jgi:hypothetical protein
VTRFGLRDLTVGKLMRREMRTVRADTRLSAFRCGFPPGSAERVVALDDAGRYAGLVLVAEAHLETLGAERVADLLRLADRVLLLGFNRPSQRLPAPIAARRQMPLPASASPASCAAAR